MGRQLTITRAPTSVQSLQPIYGDASSLTRAARYSGYQGLVIATGVSARRLGPYTSSMAGRITLRTLDATATLHTLPCRTTGHTASACGVQGSEPVTFVPVFLPAPVDWVVRSLIADVGGEPNAIVRVRIVCGRVHDVGRVNDHVAGPIVRQ